MKMKRWAILCGLAIVVIIVLVDSRDLGPLGIVYDFPYGDKIGHFLVFGLLSLLTNLAVFEACPRGKQKTLALRTSALLALPIGLEELSQRWIRGRSSSLVDLAASYLGVAVFSWLAVSLEKRRRERSTPPPESDIG